MLNPPQPIAILSAGCRLPGGVENLDDFWTLLCNGVDALVEVPASRWDVRRFYDPDPKQPGKSQVARGGFLTQNLATFDPTPFGISPREAEGLDPQQRLLLETAWEALEAAGQDLTTLRGSPTGVFIGGFCLDMQLIRLGTLNRELIDNHTAASATLTMLANRLSWCLDLRGPSVTLDTACSSSLVAVHLACQAIRQGECNLALVGGVNALLVPEYFIAMSKGQFLAPEGRSAAFSAQASGYARGEGAMIAVLKPLDAAIAAGDPILGVILASGVNQDGRTPGITLPNPEAQITLMEEVHRRAGIDPTTVTYLEAHGTGTQAGDRAELEALTQVFCRHRAPQTPLLVGAVKTNLGHLEAAAGIVGLIKAALVLHRRTVPPSLHQESPNPGFDWSNANLCVPAQCHPLPRTILPHRAAVNAFGYGGTNAHCLLEEWRESLRPNPLPHGSNTPYLLPLSAAGADALRALAARWAQRLSAETETIVPLEDLLYSAAVRRTHWAHRLSVVGTERDALARCLTAFANGEDTMGCATAEASLRRTGPVFVYSGMGPQWWGMGRELARDWPVFAAALDEVDADFTAYSGWSIRTALSQDETTSRVHETQVAQPANFALQVALTRLLAHWGIMPGAVMGHSVGEISAAWACGALTLKQAIEVVWHRSRLQQTLAGMGGGMLAASLSPEGAAGILRRYPALVIAALNGPRAVTLAGPLPDLHTLAAELERHEVFQRLLRVEMAYHSPAMEQIHTDLRAALAELTPQPPHLPWYSTVEGKHIASLADADYWWRNVRNPVRIWDALNASADDNHTAWLEIGPHPVLATSLAELAQRRNGLSLSTLHRARPESQTLLECVGCLYVSGFAVDWSRLTPPGHFVPLPSYPWQRQPFWKETQRSFADRVGRTDQTFLRERLSAPIPAWQVEINTGFFPWLHDHRIDGRVVFPGAGFIAAALDLHQELFGSKANDSGVRLSGLRLVEFLPGEGPRRNLVSMADPANGHFRLLSHAGEADDGAWTLHAEGRLHATPWLGADPPAALDGDILRNRCPHRLPIEPFYAQLAQHGLDYGPAFRRIRAIHAGRDETLLELDPLIGNETKSYPLHPCLLDAAIHGLFATLPTPLPIVPIGLTQLCLYPPMTVPVCVWVRMVQPLDATGRIKADLSFYASDGHCLATLTGLICRVLPQHTAELQQNVFYRPTWTPAPPRAPSPASMPATRWAIYNPGQSELAAALIQTGDERIQPYADNPSDCCGIIACFDALLTADYAAILTATTRLMHLLQTRVPGDAAKNQRFWLVTCGAATTATTLPNVGGAALHGLLRVAANESTAWDYRILDLDPATKINPLALWELFTSMGVAGEEIALRDHKPLRLTLTQRPAPSAECFRCLLPVSRPLLFATDTPQGWRESPELAPSIKILAWLAVPNPGGSEGLEWHGQDGNGTLYRGFGHHPLATQLNHWAGAIPASGLPFQPLLPWLLAWHILITQARLSAGHTLWIPRPSGVWADAILATAQHMGLHTWVGVDTNTRCQMREMTNGRGADAILVNNGIDLPEIMDIAPGGRLLLNGIGQPVAPLANALASYLQDYLAKGILFLSLETDAFLTDSSALTATVEQLRSQINQGWSPTILMETQCLATVNLATLRTPTWLIFDAQDQILAQPIDRTAWGHRRAGSYLITGGLSGLGLALAERLAEQGVAHLILASRRGDAAPTEAHRLAQLRTVTQVTAIALDVTDAHAVAQVCAQANPPLRGVFHGAMVLDDRWLLDIDAAALDRVLAPKIAGALNLEQACQNLELEAFVLFSSVSAWVGNPGQAAYAAANACLEALATRRRAQGLPGIAVVLGAISDWGIAARTPGILTSLEQMGVHGMPAGKILDAIGALLIENSEAITGVFDLDWPRWAATQPNLPDRIHSLAKTKTGDLPRDAKMALHSKLMTLTPQAGREYLMEALRRQLARILRLPPERIHSEIEISQLGLDSLMSLEWVLAIRQEWGVELSAVELLRAAGLKTIAERIVKTGTDCP